MPRRDRAAVRVFFSSIAIGERSDAAGDRCERARFVGHSRVDVADDQRSPPGEVRKPLGAGANSCRAVASSVSREMPDVNHGGARLDEVRRHESGASDRRDEDDRPRRRPPAGPASSNGRSSPSRRAAAAASPSACRRSRSGPTTTARAPAIAIPVRSSISITPDGVHGARSARPCTRRPTLIGMKAVDVLGRIDRVEHLLRRALAHRRRQRGLHEDAVVTLAVVELAARAPADRPALPPPAAAADPPRGRTRCPREPCCERRSRIQGRRRRARCRAPAAVRPLP